MHTKLSFHDKDVIRSIQPWIYLSTYILLLGFLLVHLQDLKNGFDFILSVFKSLLYAIVFAYVLNLPVKHIEGFLLRHTRQNSFLQKKKRVISMILTFLLALISIILIDSIILSSTIDSLIPLMENLTSLSTDIVKNIDEMLAYFRIGYRVENITQVGQLIQIPWEKIVTNVINLLSGNTNGILSSATGFVSSFVIGFTDFTFFSCLLSGKGNLVHQMCRVTAAFLGYGNSKIVFRYAACINQMFSSFIGGQPTEACVLWVLYYIFMRLFQFPYPELICTLIAVYSMVPVFGSVFAMGVGVIMMPFKDPLQSIQFTIFYQVLSYFEDNVTYPRMVGNSVGLSDPWVLPSTFVFGNLWGIFSMIMAIPATACLYVFFTEYVNHRLWKQRLIITERTVYQEDEGEHSA